MENSFRKMRRFKQQLTDEECKEILRAEERGTLAVNGDNGYPYALPMNFTFDETANSLVLHSAKSGHKLDAMRRSDKVCFCLHDKGYSETGKLPRHFKSVVIFGRIKFIDTPEEMLQLMRKFDGKFETPEAVEKHLQREAHLVQALELNIEHMTGKRVIEG
ncbi:MAG: pyridoxamine 5'-phosphate oxidase family protein [Eubacteriales bacterium]|nr:pyridoxamine 5'-phosphate oxidase family protein [Eubacteriales bacterium]